MSSSVSFEEDEARRQQAMMATSYDLDDLGNDGGVVEMRSPEVEAAIQLVGSAEAIKSAGSELVKKGDWKGAIEEYQKSLEVIEKGKKTLSADYESELLAEKCGLACRSNKALCALKLKDWTLAKTYCQQGLEAQDRAIVPDPTGRAKLLFRRGQAQLGNSELRPAIDSMTRALEIEERLLGVTNKEATLKSTDKQRLASIASIKRELQKARKIAKTEDIRTKDNFKGARGFLQGGKGTPKLTDAKTERKEVLEDVMQKLLITLFEEKDTNAQYSQIVRHIAAVTKLSKPTDLYGQTKFYFVRGFLEFMAGEAVPETDDNESEHYSKASSHFDMCWARRSEMAIARFGTPTTEDDPLFVNTDLDEDTECFFPVGKISALESTGHSMMRAHQFDPARAYLFAYADAAKAQPLQALHNLPDSFLLEKGLPKMDDKQRRAYRWKFRSHSKRAIFDAYVAVASSSRELDDRDMAMDAAFKALDIAETNEHRRAAHNNLAFLFGSEWTTYGKPTPDNKDLAHVHSTLSETFKGFQEQEAQKTKDPTPGVTNFPEGEEIHDAESQPFDPETDDLPMPDPPIPEDSD